MLKLAVRPPARSLFDQLNDIQSGATPAAGKTVKDVVDAAGPKVTATASQSVAQTVDKKLSGKLKIGLGLGGLAAAGVGAHLLNKRNKAKKQALAETAAHAAGY